MIFCLGNIILCATSLALLLVVVGVEKKTGAGVEAEKIMQVSCRGCNRNLKIWNSMWRLWTLVS